jgi:ABC-2 type transport system permease protein
VAQVIAHFFPATWYVELLQTLFMAGNVPSIVVRDMLVLAGGAVAAFAIARHCIRKSLE